MVIGAPIGQSIGAPIGFPTSAIEHTASIVLATEVIAEGRRVDEGLLIQVVAPAWSALARLAMQDPRVLFEFVNHPFKFEEFIAATYQQAGFDEVIVTPRSGDKGRDIVAIKHGTAKIRFLEQTKAYSPGRLVPNNDVRAMFGVLNLDETASKALVTTTSDFAPSIAEEFKRVMPHRLELRNGVQLARWLKDVWESQQ